MNKRQERVEFEANDFYAYLNLEVNATETEVRKHFRQLALQWHPDKHQEGPDRHRATEIFQQLNKAHTVLSDQQQRARYDAVWHQRHSGHQQVPAWAMIRRMAPAPGVATSPKATASRATEEKVPKAKARCPPEPVASSGHGGFVPVVPGRPSAKASGNDVNLQKKEKERAAAQVEWLKNSSRQGPKKAPRPSKPTEEADQERGRIEEFRRKMAKQVEQIAEKAREAPRQFSDVSPTMSWDKVSPRQKPAMPKRKAGLRSKESEPAEVSSPTVKSVDSMWSTESMQKVASDMVTIAEEVTSGVASFGGFSSWWSVPRPIIEEVKPTPANCPRCAGAMPKCVGANFCPHCTFHIT